MTNRLASLPHPALRGLRHTLSLLVLLTLLVVAQTARAQTSTSTFTVTATVLPSCTVAGGVPLAFGVVTPGIQQDGSVLISAICTVGTPFTLGLDAGTGAGATVAARRMTSGGDTLEYALFQDAARTTQWGDGTAGTSTRSSTGTGLQQTFTVYGRVPSSAAAAVGTYTDTITVTATY
ncbi:Csu type fimbrial protein [Hydrogenophaga sp. PBL-H3]|uniref:Csu type fimbrial protein n=1 Tax=Hydrogenophaga sp. PBL-H3 TaxID=434010 RepID=UPI00131F78E9|nr:spore coat U domain-containing protein [Hydrogenophaga sp. PBL-H3]QHE75088.1 spore coat U domain-containing protein [Hydrogenophaga sp. PBL-H3]QHE79515.1 spore coat U domain-containing protein [Hydrogenophaga sp. PBL-H3]